MNRVRASWFALPLLALVAGLFFVVGAAHPPAAAANPAAPNADAPRTVSATGVGLLPVAAATQPTTLNVSLRERGADPRSAAQALQSRVAAVTTALEQAGIPAASIQGSGMNIAAPAAPAGAAALQAGASSNATSGYMATESLHATLTDPSVIAAAIDVALRAGAVSAGTFNSTPANPPDAAALAPAVKDATAQTTALAQASARDQGLTLGTLQSVVVQPPTFAGAGLGPGSWHVSVTLTFDVAAATP